MKRSTFITWEQLRVGALILGALFVLTFVVFQLGQAANLFAKRYPLVVLLENADGLREGGTVTVAGQMAGVIKKIEFLPVDGDTTRNIKVTMDVDEALREQVREDSRAKVRTMGLLGDKTIDISAGTIRFGVMVAGDTLRITQSLDYQAVLVQAAGAVDDMVELTHDLRQITGGIVRGEGTVGQLLTSRSLYDRLSSTLTNTNALLVRLQAPNGTFGRMLDDPKLYVSLTSLTQSLDSLTRAMQSDKGTLGRLLRDDTLYVRLTGVITGADSMMKLMTQGQGFASRMLTDPALYDRLNKALTDFAAILEEIRRDPQKYTKGMIKVF